MTEQEAKEFLTGFIEKYLNQNNAGTAYPIYHVIRTARWEIAAEGCGERFTYREKVEFENSFAVEDPGDIFEVMKTQLEEEEIELPRDKDELEEFIEDHIYEKYDLFEERKEWEEKGLFLLRDEAQAHLERNDYHYSKCAHVYTHHVWRAPETERVFAAIKALCGVNLREGV